jgi:hypothetical protein
MKVCNSCKETKFLLQFSLSPTCKDGHRNYCKICQESRKRIWRKGNLNHCNLKGKTWRSKNQEKSIEIAKKYRKANKEKIHLYQKNWKINNKTKTNISTALRRKRIQQAIPNWANLEDIKNIYLEANYAQLQVDRIFPLKGKIVCGLHVWENLQLLSPLENTKKGNQMPSEEYLNCLS